VPLASRNPSYIEAGAYVIDNGSPVYPLQVLDDENAADPGAPGTLSGQGPGTYTAKLQFKIKYGVPNYKIEVDTAFNGTFGAGPVGNNGLNIPLVTIKDFTDNYTQEGLQNFTIQVPSNQPSANYFFAVRVTDQDSPATTSQFNWPSQVPLFPQEYLREDFNNLNNWTISTPQGGWFTDQNWASLTGATSSGGGTVVGFGGSGGFASPVPSSGTAYGDGHNKAITLTNAINIPANTSFTISFYTAGYSEDFWDGTIAEISKNNGSTWEGATYNYWGSMYPSYIYGIYQYGGYGSFDKYGFSGGSSLYGAGTSWVSHSATIPAQPTPMQLKMRFWFCSDGVFNYTPGICVDKLLIQ
jgi:hypothetical protein